MRTSDFNFDLPTELIAQYPLKNRTDSRLLCLIDGQISHQQFTDFPSLINPGDLLVFNNTKVIPARMYLHKNTGGKVEILLERVLDETRFLAHLKASKGAKIGTKLFFAPTLPLPRAVAQGREPNPTSPACAVGQAEGQDPKFPPSCTHGGGLGWGEAVFEVIGRHDNLFEIQNITDTPLLELFAKQGHMPLPPYITRSDEHSDQERYQTVYAKEAGAVAAPTAGLHFDGKILEELKAKGVNFCFVTLHVGAGTFQPVRVENITEHKMHAEYIEVSEQVCAQVRATKAAGKCVIAIGTTSVRCLETACSLVSTRGGAQLNCQQDAFSCEAKKVPQRQDPERCKIEPYSGDTQIFIYPGYEFKCVDALLTNFHLPESTLLMLVCAFAGYESVMGAYHAAITEKYRFFSYGDAMFLSRDSN